jgi:hypothetical protein
MEQGGTYTEALAEAQRLGFAEADPTDDVEGADAAAKMAILATVAFNSRVLLDDVSFRGIDSLDPVDVVAARELDMVIRLVGTSVTGFLQFDACCRELGRLDPSAWRSPFYAHLHVADRPGVLAHAASRLAEHDVSVAQLVQRLDDGRASLDLVLHEAPAGRVADALEEIAALPEVLEPPFLAPVVTERPL